MDLRDYLLVLRRSWIRVIALTLLGALAGVAVALVSTPQYLAESKVFVSLAGTGSVADLAQGNSFAQARVRTYADLVSTPAVLTPAAREMSGHVRPGELGRQVSASVPLDTSLIVIRVQSPSPTRAAEAADAIAESLTVVVRGLERSESDAGSSPVRLSMVQPATRPSAPTSPHRTMDAAVGMLAGLVLGIAWAVLRSVLDTRVRSAGDAEAATDLPVLARIPRRSRRGPAPILTSDDTFGPLAESYRVLRTNLQFVGAAKGGGRSFVLTSSVPGEGKTTTASNLARTLADAGLRVALVDADLRRPRVAEVMGIEGAVGLSDLLIGQVELDDVLQQWGRGTLSVLPAGSTPPNPSELLGSEALATLVDELRSRFDYVLFDAPPVLPVTDAAVLARCTSGVVLTVGVGEVRTGQLRTALAALRAVGAPVCGVVVNKLPMRDTDSYGAGYAGDYRPAVTPDPSAQPPADTPTEVAPGVPAVPSAASA